ncbi:TRAP transporter small permease subunit [Sneathiella limimaris]|uniref:TRAP transporter small permease subunit n=1 Tax=Sneathiella limimaris TaxID=1964213 RepID=UPI00146D30CD|nr:TRAP transporter small permease [Sneathiella limimaris]
MPDRIINRLSRFAAVLACIILVLMVAMIMLEILLRSAFNTSTYVLDEFVGYGVAAMTFLSFAATLKDGVFIRVEMILCRLGPGLRHGVEIISCLLSAGVFSLLTFYFGRLLIRNFERGVVSNSIAEVPLWIPQSFVVAGLALLVLQFLSMTTILLRGKDLRHHPEMEASYD